TVVLGASHRRKPCRISFPVPLSTTNVSKKHSSGHSICNQSSNAPQPTGNCFRSLLQVNSHPVNKSSSQLVAIVDDDLSVQTALKDLMESAGFSARCFGSAEEFLESDERNQIDCL